MATYHIVGCSVPRPQLPLVDSKMSGGMRNLIDRRTVPRTLSHLHEPPVSLMHLSPVTNFFSKIYMYRCTFIYFTFLNYFLLDLFCLLSWLGMFKRLVFRNYVPEVCNFLRDEIHLIFYQVAYI